MWGRNSWSGCQYHQIILKCHGHCLRNTVVQSFDITGCARNHDAHDSWGHEWMFSRGPVAEQGQKFSPQVGFVDWWAQPNVFYQQRWKKKAWSLSFHPVVSKSGLVWPCFRDQHSGCPPRSHVALGRNGRLGLGKCQNVATKKNGRANEAGDTHWTAKGSNDFFQTFRYFD